VGRKLPVRAGASVRELLAEMRAIDADLAAAGPDLGTIRANLADRLADLDAATEWVLANGATDPNQALAASSPYLRMFGMTVGGWLMARAALAATALLGRGEGDAEFLRAKVVTARFYAEQVLPQAGGLLGAVRAGAADLFAIEPKYLVG
jgi:hypothetical protein